MDAATFNKFRQVIYEKSGINLNPGKEALVSARVGKRMRALRIDDHREYLRHVLEDESGDELVHLIDAISTNVTSFFREPPHFELLRGFTSQWLSEGQRRFRFWSAASSTGEEPYTMAMTLLEVFGSDVPDVRILATDISTRVLQQASAGVYKADRLETLSKGQRERFFETRRDGEGAVVYKVRDEMRRLISFQRLNLSTPPFPMKGPFDCIFCRNVMIYFDNEVRSRLLNEIFRLLKPGGYLMVGHAESLTGMMSPFKIIKPSVYIKP